MSDDLLIESLANAAEEHGIILPAECLKTMADAVEALSEYRSYGQECTHESSEIALRKEFEREKNKRVCNECNGKGGRTVMFPGGIHTSFDRCCACNGTGFIY